MASVPPVHVIPAAVGAALSPTAASILTLFVAKDEVRSRYAAAVDRYSTAVHALALARASLGKFEKRCAVTDGAGRLTLPRSLALNLVKSARLPAVVGEDSFFKEEISTLHAIEATATKALHDVLLAAKRKHIEHLHKQSNLHAFMNTESTSYREFVVA